MELELGQLDTPQALERAEDYAEYLDGQPAEEIELLVERLCWIAAEDGCNPNLLNCKTDKRLTVRQRKLCTPAVLERAERRQIEQYQAELDRIQRKARAENPRNPMPILPKRDDGYWLDARQFTPDVPEYGPYETLREAQEARASFIRSEKLRAGAARRNRKPVTKTCKHEYKRSGGVSFCVRCLERRPKKDPKTLPAPRQRR